MERDYLYFAYGSNLDLNQMQARCSNAFTLLGNAELPNFRFFINKRGYANIVPNDGSKVLGVVFELVPLALKALDIYEGYPKIYARERFSVLFEDCVIEPWVYIDRKALEIGPPKPDYLEKVVAAAKRFNFPKEYLKQMESFLT